MKERLGSLFHRAAQESLSRNELARKAWLEQTLRKVPAGTRILDAGAGELANRAYCRHLHYVSQDFARYDGAGNRKGLHTGGWDTSRVDIISDITAIPEPDAAFGAILCSEVLEHVPEPLAALKEFARLLCPGGQLILTAPFCSLTHFAPFFFCTGFSPYFYTHHLPRLGFDVAEIAHNGDYFAYLAQELTRLPAVSERYAGRRLGLHLKIALRLLVPVLTRLSSRGSASGELLCFGVHVLAVKKPES